MSARRAVAPRPVLRALLLLGAVATSACGELPASPTIGTISADGLSGQWRLELLQPAGQGAILAPAGSTYTLDLDGGRASVRADCNTCTGQVRLVGDVVSVSPLACTRALCPTAEFEAIYTRLLAGDSRVTVSGPDRSVTFSSSRGFLRFRRL